MSRGVSGPERTGEDASEFYWAFLERRLLTQAFNIASSQVDDPVFGRVYGPLFQGCMSHNMYQEALFNLSVVRT